MSMPSNSSLSAVVIAFDGSRRRIERAVSDLPEPDSPTMPSFAWPRVRETLRTASEKPEAVGNWIRRLRISTSIICLHVQVSKVHHKACPRALDPRDTKTQGIGA